MKIKYIVHDEIDFEIDEGDDSDDIIKYLMEVSLPPLDVIVPVTVDYEPPPFPGEPLSPEVIQHIISRTSMNTEQKLVEAEIKMRELLTGIRKVRDEIISSHAHMPRWVSMDLNALCNQFMDEKGNLI